jgi:hypothetical protein
MNLITCICEIPSLNIGQKADKNIQSVAFFLPVPLIEYQMNNVKLVKKVFKLI